MIWLKTSACAFRYCGRGALDPNLITSKFSRGRSMIRTDRKFDRMSGLTLCLLAVARLASAGDDARGKRAPPAAPMDIPHTTKVELDARTAKKRAPNIEKPQLLNPMRGLSPLQFPRNTDIRARILTPELRRTPLVGWIAENLYRDPKDNGWCLEADPGQSEYVVFYRWNLK
jgi:hypothetical protein